MSVVMLAFANLRKQKGSGISLMVLVLIAALLLNLGLMGVANLSRVVDAKVASLHTPQVSVVISGQVGAARRNEIEQAVSEDRRTLETQSEQVLYLPSASFSMNKGGSYSNTVLLESVEQAGKLGRLSFAGKTAQAGERSIYLPYLLASYGYKLGGAFTLHYRNQSYTFTVAGFTEDLLWGNTTTGGLRCFLSQSAYDWMTRELGGAQTRAALLSARTRSLDDGSALYDKVNQMTSKNPTEAFLVGVYSLSITKMATSMPVTIGAALEIAFAFVVSLVVLLVVRFRVTNSIEEDMRNIGALEAVGFTSGQIRGMYLLQFCLLTLIGGTVGIALSYAVAVPHGRVLAAETGLVWTQPFDLRSSLVTLAVLIVCVALVALFATGRLRRLPVTQALRDGAASHNFRRNYFPLARTRGPLGLLLALKSTLAGLKQHAALALVLAAVSFASVFTFLLFYNFGVNNTAVMHIMGGEPDDILIAASGTSTAQSLQSELKTLPAVRQVIGYGYLSLNAEGMSAYGRATADFGKLENNQVYRGRYPKHDNEVAIDGKLAASLHKTVGDSIRLTLDGESHTYLITGFTQSISTLGKGVYITDDGLRQLDAAYRPVTLYVYLHDGSDTDAVIHTINARFGSQISGISNDRATARSVIGTYSGIVAGFSTLIFILMAVIVALILVLLTGAALVRRRRDFGIEKALGFTNGQLMRQVAIGFLPVSAAGALFGGILGWFGANPLCSLLFGAMGIMKTDFILPGPSVPAICLVVALLTYGISMLAARRLRAISPCVLMGE